MTDFAFNTPFQEQIDFLRAKLRLPTERWDDILRSAHDRAFIVAGAAKADLLADLHESLTQAATDGRGLDAWRKDFRGIVEKHGWRGWTGDGTKGGEAWRTRVIYQTNMATSYAAGRYRQLTDPGFLALRPFWRYIHSDSVMHPRPWHLAWHGLTLPADHEFWKTHFPPNGWGCQCRVTAVSKREGEASARAGLADPPEGWRAVDGKSGEPVGIDKGFGYAPGASVNKPMQEFIDAKLIKLDAPIGARMWEALTPTLAREMGPRLTAFSEWANGVRESGRTIGEFRVIDAIDSAIISKLQEHGVAPATAEIVVRDHDVLHTFRDTKAGAVPWDWYVQLPLHVQRPKAVLLDKSRPGESGLLYVFDIPSDATARMVVKLDYEISSKGADGVKRKKALNVLRTGGLVKPGDLKNPKAYVLLAGEL